MRLLRLLVVLAACAVSVSAQKPCCGGGISAQPKTPPAALSMTADDLIASFRGNEASPSMQHGVSSLFHVLFPNSDIFIAPDTKHGGYRWEHIITGHDQGDPFGKPQGKWFSPDYGTMTATKLDAHTVQLVRPLGADVSFPGVSAVQTFTVEGNHVDLEAWFHVANISAFQPEGLFGVFFANYMNLVLPLGLTTLAVEGPGDTPHWMTLNGGTFPGGTYMHRDASQLPYTPPMRGDSNVKAANYPRFTQPFYSVALQSGAQMCLMLRSLSGGDLRFAMFRYFVKNEADPTTYYPAADWVHWIHNVQVGDYGVKTRMAILPSTDPNACLAEYQAWVP